MKNLSNIQKSIKLPSKIGERIDWGGINTSANSLVISQVAQNANHPIVVVAKDQQTSVQMVEEFSFFLAESDVPVLLFPDWETLPYDHFSPHKDIISDRLSVLFQLPTLKKGILVVSASTLMHRVVPKDYVNAYCFVLELGEILEIEPFLERLQKNGYQRVSQVLSHGEMSVRGSIIDIFPMGSKEPYRIDLLDDEVDSIRTFDPETQRTIEKAERIHVLPAREFPLNKSGIERFRAAFRSTFEFNEDLNLKACTLYQNISQQQVSPGIEYYIPLFFDEMASLFNYFPEDTLLFRTMNLSEPVDIFLKKVGERYEQLGVDITRPLLPPKQLFLLETEFFGALKKIQQIQFHEENQKIDFKMSVLPELGFSHKANELLEGLKRFLSSQKNRVLFSVETPGRREMLLSLLSKIEVRPHVYSSWSDFLTSKKEEPLGLVVSPLLEGFLLESEGLTFLPEEQLLGDKVSQRKKRKGKYRDTGTLLRNLNELEIGDPVVHVDHGVGRYLGLETMETDELTVECLILEYANQSKLYVPVSSLHLINRFSGVDLEHAPLHALGSKQWDKAKKKALSKIRDVAAELLDVYARRESKPGLVYQKPNDYEVFAEGFPFEETPDQQGAIQDVLGDMMADRHMDRLVCGDVGFGKTEVAMRAAFMAVQNHKQVAILVPTTVLAEQHYQNFKNRFADWPINIASISRFSQAKDQKKTLEQLKAGQVDIVVGTHRLLQPNVTFKDLGLLIIDEEHRFGVSHKEKIKSKKTEVDVLTLTATPIPRTLNMAMNGIWDMSLIATPPAGRLAVKTFVQRYEAGLIKEAILRESLRGGLVYFVHNRVETIDSVAEKLKELIPGIKVGVAHGQMPESELERTMSDFHHHRFNILLCTTIVESGIDIPTANTIIIDRADRFGMAQLHQLRGRVGRSHHQAYAYLLLPEEGKVTTDAKRRLEALSLVEDLGAGFNLASHDLEIRGAGELLGDEQSGHIQTIGFGLYTELLEKAVAALKEGKAAGELTEMNLMQDIEVDLGVSALIPENYVPDVHARLVLYKRIASAKDDSQLDDLKVELIDRFGLMPDPVKSLFFVTELKIQAKGLEIQKIKVGEESGRLYFGEMSDNPSLNVDALIGLVQKNPHQYQLRGDQLLAFNLSDAAPEARFRSVKEVLKALRV